MGNMYFHGPTEEDLWDFVQVVGWISWVPSQSLEITKCIVSWGILPTQYVQQKSTIEAFIQEKYIGLQKNKKRKVKLWIAHNSNSSQKASRRFVAFNIVRVLLCLYQKSKIFLQNGNNFEITEWLVSSSVCHSLKKKVEDVLGSLS